MSKQKVIFCRQFLPELEAEIGTQKASSIFILTDDITHKLCLPLLLQSQKLREANIITIPNGDSNKTLDTLAAVWKYLSEHGATRKSLMINLGGGMITDLGGFAASTFKRGMDYINIPTTLLGAVDAAVGGKTGINFLGLKNEIGVINPAKAVLIETDFFRTLDHQNMLSGIAEILKHALISSPEEWWKVLQLDLENINFEVLKSILQSSITIKEEIVEKDPNEQNIRKALNLGHTIGHAFESYSYETGHPVLHGYAVAWGLICELYLSHKKTGFPKQTLLQVITLVREAYGVFALSCKDYDRLYELMTHDKKNDSKEVRFTLLSDIGQLCINEIASEKEIFEALDFYCDSLGI